MLVPKIAEIKNVAHLEMLCEYLRKAHDLEKVEDMLQTMKENSA